MDKSQRRLANWSRGGRYSSVLGGQSIMISKRWLFEIKPYQLPNIVISCFVRWCAKWRSQCMHDWHFLYWMIIPAHHPASTSTLNLKWQSEVWRRSDTVVVPTVNNATLWSGRVIPLTSRAASGKPKSLSYSGEYGCKAGTWNDIRALPGVEPAA